MGSDLGEWRVRKGEEWKGRCGRDGGRRVDGGRGRGHGSSNYGVILSTRNANPTASVFNLVQLPDDQREIKKKKSNCMQLVLPSYCTSSSPLLLSFTDVTPGDQYFETIE